MYSVLFRRLIPGSFLGVFLSGASSLFAVDPRLHATDYPSHAESAALSVGAEYLVHSLSNGSQMFSVPEYLVVDTAVYPHAPLDLKRDQFSLRMTLQGKSRQPDETVVLHASPPTMVGYATTSAINAVPPEMRSPAGSSRPTSPVPRGSDQTGSVDSNGSGGVEGVSDVVSRMGLPEGMTRNAQGGYLYFGFSGKTKKIKALELIYGEGDSALVVKLF